MLVAAFGLTPACFVLRPAIAPHNTNKLVWIAEAAADFDIEIWDADRLALAYGFQEPVSGAMAEFGRDGKALFTIGRSKSHSGRSTIRAYGVRRILASWFGDSSR